MGAGREWHYWSRNKLDILGKYLRAFNIASYKRAEERVYLDLMAGQPENRDAVTGEAFDGSARLAMSTDPPFTRLAFGEMPRNAQLIQSDLEARHPGREFKVYPGDCNATVHQMLKDLEAVRWAPTFAFLDQQAAELRWETMLTLAAWKRDRKFKVEQWILWSPSMLIRELEKASSEPFARKVDQLYGGRHWRGIWRARHEDRITPEEFRAEMVNLVRWQFETELGYRYTARIPMKMKNNVGIYDMVFASDNDAGMKIMSDLYAKAAEREPKMRLEALEATQPAQEGLFEIERTPPPAPKWRPEPCWDPTSWWSG